MIIDSLQGLAVPIESLQGLPGNPRVGDVAAVVASLERFGQRKPIVVRREDGTIIAGNHTWQAAKELGWKEIAVAFVTDDDATAQAFALADNRTSELGTYDDEALKVLIEKVAAVDPELVTASGWSEDAVQELLDKIEASHPAELNEDAIPEVAETTESKLGDMWQLGNHRLLCGDATNIDEYSKLLNTERVDLIWTDPPYGVAYVGKTKDALTIENDRLSIADLEVFLRKAFKNMFEYTKPGACWYITAPSGNLFQAFSIPLTELDVWRHTLVWVKDTLVMGRADYHYRHESIFYGWTPGAAHHAPPDRKQDSVWEIDRPKVNKEHPTMKPIELVKRSLENSTNLRDIVLDTFSGSGSSLMACEETGRYCRSMELDPKYCDVIIKRWETLTGKSAVKLNA